MIEFCTVRRMIATIIFLGLVTIISVVVESKYEMKNVVQVHHDKAKDPQEGHSTDGVPCWFINANSNDYKIVEQCRACYKWEREKDFCQPSNYIEKVQCVDNSTGYKSCEEPSWIQQRSFWVHQGVWLLVGVVSYIFVHMRRSALDQRLLDRVNKQIASGV